MLFGSSPILAHLRVFGCACFPLLKPYNSTKLQAKTKKCVFLRYAIKYKGYLCYHVHPMRLFISRHVIFDEQQFPYPDLLPTHSNTLTSPSPNQPSPYPVPIVTLANVIVPTIPASPSLPPRAYTPVPFVVFAHS